MRVDRKGEWLPPSSNESGGENIAGPKNLANSHISHSHKKIYLQYDQIIWRYRQCSISLLVGEFLTYFVPQNPRKRVKLAVRKGVRTLLQNLLYLQWAKARRCQNGGQYFANGSN